MTWLGRGTDALKGYRAPSPPVQRRRDIVMFSAFAVAIFTFLGAVLWTLA